MEGIELYRAEEVADILKVSLQEAYKLMQQGQLPVIRIGRCVRVTKADLIEFIEKNRQVAPSAV